MENIVHLTIQSMAMLINFFLRIGYIYEQVFLKPDESFINYICPISSLSRGMF